MNITGIMWSEFCILLASVFFAAFSFQNNVRMQRSIKMKISAEDVNHTLMHIINPI